jgi:hypothetical protein
MEEVTDFILDNQQQWIPIEVNIPAQNFAGMAFHDPSLQSDITDLMGTSTPSTALHGKASVDALPLLPSPNKEPTSTKTNTTMTGAPQNNNSSITLTDPATATHDEKETSLTQSSPMTLDLTTK